MRPNEITIEDLNRDKKACTVAINKILMGFIDKYPVKAKVSIESVNSIEGPTDLFIVDLAIEL